MTAYDKTFDDIRPFTDQEAIAALPKAIRIPYLEQVIRYGLPDLTLEQLKSLIASCTCVRDFIEKAIYPAVQRLLDHTSEGVTFRGLGALDKDKGYLFLSNHRDIGHGLGHSQLRPSHPGHALGTKRHREQPRP